MKRIISCILLVTCYLLLATPTHALSQFSTDYLVTYDVAENGVTDVTFEITQKNNLSTVYATSFSLSLNQTKLDTIRVTQGNKSITPEVKNTQNLTNINFDFANRIVGKDKENTFKISFKTTDIAQKYGAVWEINIPKLETDENTNDQKIILKVPTSFGQPTYLDPKPKRTENQNIYHFDASNLGNRAISAIFGDTQYYRLNLRYQLTNPLKQNLATQIAIPPDTAYQQVMIEKIDPKPLDIQSDPDGNWLASYKIPSSENLKVDLTLAVKLLLIPKKNFATNLDGYLRPSKLWDYSDQKISDKLPILNTPQSIYDFVVTSLNYNYERLNQPGTITRGGALFALTNPSQAICLDFSDLFIALARKNNLPSRELQGFVLSSNEKLKPLSLTKDVLHSWVEYYDSEKNTWIQVDPTWGNTTNGIDYFRKLDLNHIVFAIHGQNPTQPLPAGAYKNSISEGKDVSVELVPKLNFPDPILDVSPPVIKNGRIVVQINNKGSVSLTSDLDIPSTSHTYPKKTTLYIPPFSTTNLEIDIRSRPLFRSVTENLIIPLNGQTVVPITIGPHFDWTVYFYLGGGGLIVSTLISWHLHFRRRQKNSPLHW